MRLCIVVLLLAAFAEGVVGNELKLPGAPFSHQGVTLIWKATNDLPSGLWVYKEVDGQFPPELTSQILALGSFKKSDKKKIPSGYPIRHKDLIRYESKDGTRRLDIIPALGWVDYDNSKAVVSARRDGNVDGVPTVEQAQGLALGLAERLGIERRLLATNTDTGDLKMRFMAGTRGWFDHELGRLTKETNSVGVNFVRQLDGVAFAGGWASGGFSVDFGNRQEIAKLNLSWRNLKRHELRHVSSPQTMLERVKRGEATMAGPLLDAAQVNSLTVTSVMPFYFAGIGYQRQPFIYPFAILMTKADLGHTNVVFELNCAILDADSLKP